MYKIVALNGKPHLFCQGGVSTGQRLVKDRYVELDGKFVKPTRIGRSESQYTTGQGRVTYTQYFYRTWNIIEKHKIWSDIGIISELGGYEINSIIKERDIKISKGVIKLKMS